MLQPIRSKRLRFKQTQRILQHAVMSYDLLRRELHLLSYQHVCTTRMLLQNTRQVYASRQLQPVQVLR